MKFEIIEPKGGTELMVEGLMQRINPELLKYVDIITNDYNKLKEFNGKKKVVWVHDLAEDSKYDNFDNSLVDVFVFVSNWQMQQFTEKRKIPYNQCVVIPNAIEPIEIHEKPKNDKIRLVYTPTPHRGLSILYSAIQMLSQVRNDFEVDIYSSFNLYGWTDAQKENEKFFEELDNHPNINYHGTVSNEELISALKKCHIFVYPSIYKETSCRCLIEALSAGCLSIVPNYGALIESGQFFTYMYQYENDHQKHAEKFTHLMNNAIDSFWNEDLQNSLKLQKIVIDSYYSWNVIIQKWTSLLNQLNNEKGTIGDVV